MDFRISKRAFYNALSAVARAISANSPLPSLSGIKIEVSSEEIVLTGSDSEISIQKRLLKGEDDFVLDIKEPGSIVIEAKYILEIVRKIDADEIHVEIIDGSLTKISGHSAEFNINGMKAVDYPMIDFSKPQKQFTIEADVLAKIINQTSFATSDKETRPVLTGVNFKAEGNRLECVATDSYRLARKIVSLSESNHFNITIPSKALSEIVKTIERDSNVLVCVSDKKAQFWIDHTVIQTRLIDGVYPETGRLIPSEFMYELTVDTRDMLNAIDRASFIKSEGISIIKLSASEKEIVISSKSQEVGSSTEKLTAIQYKGKPLEISFSGRYVFDAIRVLNGPIVKIEFCGEMKPFIIRNMDDDSVLQLVLPVRTYS
ncbi:MAG: DNA polymerase III subunit beta [Erysipelotrichaceae bacterium]|nr:DNA polymerase III subunit beta [Erysipelotrichaceae bacterium]MDP3305720.1 DNA polymerase III subunit beta [Erysipelotrichaceae bacterium]